MTRHFNRNAKLVVYRTTTPESGEDFFVQKTGGPDGKSTNGIEITDLRFVFDIDRDLSKHPNRCDIKIWNLAPKTRAAMETKPLSVEILAGYDGVNSVMYTGDVIFAQSKQEGSDWMTMLQVGDGARAFASSRVNRSYKSGTSIKTILRDVAKSMGQVLPRNVEDDPDLDVQVASGTSLRGASRDEITRIITPFGYSWSMQNGQLQILRDEDSRNDILELSERTGMIGTPEFGDPPKSGKSPRMTVRNLLYPDLRPGGRVQLTSRAKSGRFKIIRVRHDGDTHGDAWNTEVEIKPI